MSSRASRIQRATTTIVITAPMATITQLRITPTSAIVIPNAVHAGR